MPHALSAETDPPHSAARMISRIFVGTTALAALTALLSAAVLALLPPDLALSRRLPLVACCVAFALACGLAVSRSRRPNFALNAVWCALATGAIALIAFAAWMLSEGVHSPTLGFYSLIVCIIGAITGLRNGLVLGALSLATLVFLGWAEASGALVVGAVAASLHLALAFQALVVCFGIVGGALIARVIDHYLRAAEEREQRFRGLLRLATDWYWEQDRDFRFTAMTEASADLLAPAHPEHADRLGWQTDGMGHSDEALDAHRADLETHRPFSGLLARRRDAGGRWRTLSVSGEPKYDPGGAFTGYWGVARDVTDEVLTQRAVAASETRYRELFTRSPSPLFLHRRGMVFDANEAAARLFGYPNAAAMNGLNIVTLFPAGGPRERVGERLQMLETMAVGEGLAVTDFQLRAVDGRALSVQSTAVRVDTTSGPANLSIFFDISARKAVEGALRRSEAMLSHLFATSPDCISLTDMASGRYAMVNPAFCRLTGYGAEEVVGRTGPELSLWQDPSQYDRLLAELAREGTVLDMPAVFISKSGSEVSMLLAAGRFVMDRRDYLVVNARDVTESERTRLQHAAILERASIGIAFTRDNRFVQANPFFERMFDWPSGELVGQPDAVVWPSPEDHREIGELAGPLLSAGHPFEIERRMRRRDGSRFWCRLLAQAVDRNEPSRGGTIWIAEDVTERRRLDEALAAARDAAESASRAKSAFLANTSHEIRTPLNGLLGLTRLAMAPELPDARRQQYLVQILDSAQSLAGIMSDILDVSKIEAGKFALDDIAFDLRETLRAVHHAYESLAEVKGLALLLSIDEDLPAIVRGDPVRVRQILANFITNALKFTDRGHVRIEASRGEGDWVHLAVRDTGPGVTAETQERLFRPFSQGDSSTTRRFGGTGLGLSICRELAQLMGGRVGVDSMVGSGSTFWAELPLPHCLPTGAPANTEAVDLARLDGARVLMAEDNPVNMMIAVAMLEHWGVAVAQAVDGREAVDAVLAAADAGHPYDVVVMDLQMPVMGGYEAARELRRHEAARKVPIVALTAAALVSEREEALEAGMDDFLTKPIDANRLRQTLARLVTRRASV
ncbi:MAG: PAS domain S-box protein [Pseudomonadota bacterium]|nr:PAS domain S-box protein [Pseudomonadota bacterium]